MEKLTKETNKYSRYDLDHDLKSAYAVALKDPDFKKLINTLKIKEDVAYKYTTKLEKTVCNLKNCAKCKSLNACTNEVEGAVYYPTINNGHLDFNYVACKYKKKDITQKESVKSKFYNMPYEIKTARMADIDVKDAKRLKIIKWLDNFYENFKDGKTNKGLFLHGSFGSGKTYLISALLNELSTDYTTVIIYYPELLRSLKESFVNDDFGLRMNEIKTCDLLLLDDIGAETVTEWNRDEILGTILQYRMDNKLPTFFTSNLNINELENHFTIKKDTEELIKSKRIMERIKQLTDDLELVSENRRK
jgi:primosomal protein DnaI